MMSVNEFLQQLVPPFTGEELFDQLSDVVYFIKDARGAYVVVNNTLVVRCRVPNKQALLGRTPADVMRSPLGQQFADQDQRVLKSGTPLFSQLELHIHASCDVGWCLTTKIPLRNRHHKVVGLVGISQDLRLPNFHGEEYEQVAIAISHAEQRLEYPPTIAELAQLADISPYQLDRRMQSVFGLTTGQWLLKLRIDHARHLLQNTSTSISIIAIQSGYADQSAFSRQFRKATGLTPREYRAVHKRSD